LREEPHDIVLLLKKQAWCKADLWFS